MPDKLREDLMQTSTLLKIMAKDIEDEAQASNKVDDKKYKAMRRLIDSVDRLIIETGVF